jgi:hypothetical protein
VSDHDFSGVRGENAADSRLTVRWFVTLMGIATVVVSIVLLAFNLAVPNESPNATDTRPFDRAEWATNSHARAGMLDDLLERGVVCPGTDTSRVLAALGEPDSTYRSTGGRDFWYRTHTTGLGAFIVTVADGQVHSIQMGFVGYRWPKNTCWS